MKKSFLLLAAAAMSLSGFTLTACNTVEGAGRDIEAGGEALQDAAQ